MLPKPHAPDDAIAQIARILDTSAGKEMMTLPAKAERLFDSLPHIIYLKRGVVTVRNTESRKIVMYFYAPSVVAMINDGFSCAHLYLRAETGCDIYQAALLDMQDNARFLFSLLRVLSYQTHCLFLRDEINNAGCVYAQVREGLLMLLDLPETVRYLIVRLYFTAIGGFKSEVQR